MCSLAHWLEAHLFWKCYRHNKFFCAYLTAVSVFSRLVWKGCQQSLGVDDLWPARKEDSAEEIVACAEREWKKCRSRTQQWVLHLESVSWTQLGSFFLASRWYKQICSQVLVCHLRTGFNPLHSPWSARQTGSAHIQALNISSASASYLDKKMVERFNPTELFVH